jgi:hypothetical protein
VTPTDPEPDVDFRSQRMDSPDGKGIARRAWESYVGAVEKLVETPPVQAGIEKMAAATALDLFGFWLWWHLEGGYEGLRRAGMSRSAIYRRLRQFRKFWGVHPDEFELPGVTIDVKAFQEGKVRL